MKVLKGITTILLLMLTVSITAQQGINYKALIKDNIGNVVANQVITIEFRILRGPADALVYSEDHNPTTDANGIVIANIGEGSVLHGNFNAIDWALDYHSLQVMIDIGGGLIDFGRSIFQTVPYAIQADSAILANTALNVNGLEAIDEGNGIGWRFVGKDPDNYGIIGANAVDLSFSTLPASNVGASGFASFATGVTTKAFGDRSTAMGLNTEASGDTSTALGNSTIASGDYATSMGLGTIASGNYSTSLGWNTEASGLYSQAGGNGSDAIGEASFAFGEDNTATGNYTLSFGHNSNSTQDYAIAMGFQADADGLGSFAAGYSPWASGNYSVALGQGATSSGEASLAMGRNTHASGFISTAMGSLTFATGDYSMSTGKDTEATGYASFSSGNFTDATGSRSFAIGNFTVAGSTGSFASGNSTLASGNYSSSFGSNTRAQSLAGVAIGAFNLGGGSFQTWIATDPLFEIGIGTADNARANAFTVLKNGNTGLGTANPNNRLQITDGTDVSASNALGFLVLGNSNGTNIGFDNNEIQARNNNSPATLYLQNEHGPNASLSDNAGYMVLGNENSINMVFDANDVQARNNGSASILFLQQYGGDVAVGNQIVHSSDRRLKRDIIDIPYGLNEILQLQPKSYYWKNNSQSYRSLGLIAQDVQEIISSIVRDYNDEQKTLSISYTELIPVLIKAVQEQQEIIEQQYTEIESMRSKFDARLKQIEAVLKTD